jgi:type I restriction enzyme S subunit
MSVSKIFPSTWMDAALGQIAEFEMGQAPPGDACNHEGKGKLFVKAGEFGVNKPIEREWTTMPLKFGRQGDVFICVVGATCGKLNLGADCAIGRSVAAIRPGEIIAQHFLYYQLQLQVMALRAASAGSAQGVINRKQLSEIVVRIAPLAEQSRIVAKIEELFSDLDAGVAALKRAKANLKRYRASVLKSAVEGKLTEQWRAKHPAKEPASALLARILLERRQKWEADQLTKFAAAKKEPPKNWRDKYVEPTPPDTDLLPDRPDGWTVANVDQLMTTITSGSRDWTQYYGSGTGTFIMAQNVRKGLLDLAYRQEVNPPPNDRDRIRSQVVCNDLLVTIVGANTGDVCRVANELPEHYVCQSVALMRPVVPSVAKYLEAYFIADHGGQKYFRGYIYGQGRPHLGFDELRMTPVVLPPLHEQEQVIAEVEQHLSVIDAAEKQIEHGLLRAARLRQSILKRAFEGKLVSQDPKDEQASALLERLRASRTHDEANGTSATSKQTRAKIKESSGEPRTRIRRRASTRNQQEE